MVTNPSTGRKIKKGGKTHFDILKKTESTSHDLVNKVRNPGTGRLVTVGSSLHTKLVKEGVLSQQASVEKKALKYAPLKTYKVPSKFPKFPVDRSDEKWGTKKPQSVDQRRFIKEKCGDPCFLLPEFNKFPICNKTLPCTYNCRGIKGASARAGEWKYSRVLEISKKLSADKGCLKNPRK